MEKIKMRKYIPRLLNFPFQLIFTLGWGMYFYECFFYYLKKVIIPGRSYLGKMDVPIYPFTLFQFFSLIMSLFFISSFYKDIYNLKIDKPSILQKIKVLFYSLLFAIIYLFLTGYILNMDADSNVCAFWASNH